MVKAGELEITVLGSSGSYASPDNPCTGFLVRSADALVLHDCGPGTLGPLQAAADLADVTAIVISHCHPDHWLELPVIRNVFTWFQPRTGVPVYGTARTRAMEASVSVVVPGATEPLDWTTIDATSELEIGDQNWRFEQTDHPVETLAARVTVGERSAVFTSDTGPGWSFADFGHRADVVFSDASHLSTMEGIGIPHLSARQAASRATDAECGRLVLTHLVPGSDPVAHRADAVTAFGGPIDVALPGFVAMV